MTAPRIAVIGAGPAGLMAAETAARAGAGVTVFDAMPSPARKFLMAGRGGLNLTHSTPMPRFLDAYGDAAPQLAPHIAAFPPEAQIAWCEGLGQPVFTGSSGRVFPRAMKASPLLRAWLARLAGLGVELRTRHRWQGFGADGAQHFTTPAGPVEWRADATVLTLGGASWPRLGSDGAWATCLPDVAPFAPANAGLRVEWSPAFAERFAGQPLKRVALSFPGFARMGEAMVTATGLEGGLVYAASAALRAHLPGGITIDLRPDLELAALRARLGEQGAMSRSNWLRKRGGLPPVAVALLREAAPHTDIATRIKALPLHVPGMMGLERAISSAGGLRWAAVDARLMLRARPGVFVAGEMLDWEAPTGGWLLTACLARGRAAGAAAAAAA
jgi:uncharacterized flavoprotein (TIGR03862 family)